METLSKRATSVAHLTNFSFEFFKEIFTADACLLFVYHGAKKLKPTRNSSQGGPWGYFSHLWSLSLNFFVWKLLENYENDTNFVRMRSSAHLGDA